MASLVSLRQIRAFGRRRGLRPELPALGSRLNRGKELRLCATSSPIVRKSGESYFAAMSRYVVDDKDSWCGFLIWPVACNAKA